MEKEKVIIDGDWGGDEMQLAAVLLAHPDQVDVLGATATFGNAALEHTFGNGRSIMHMLHGRVKVYPGAKEPSDPAILVYDGAHGENGIGGVQLAPSPEPVETQPAAEFILEQLKSAPDHSITITASGPLTNIAQCIRDDAETMQKVKRIVIMGGCTQDMPAHDMEVRRGNISPHAEFNFLAAPADAETVMQSGLPITLLPMNCTHGLTLTPERAGLLRMAYLTRPDTAKTILQMMQAPADLDRRKFNSSPVMHDIHCALNILHPEAYVTEKGKITVTQRDGQDCFSSHGGHTEFTPDGTGNITVATAIRDVEKGGADKLFATFLSSIQKCMPPQKEQGVTR